MGELINISEIKDHLPYAVIVAALIVIMMVYISQIIVEAIEDAVEKKKGKEIKLFDHKKIWLSFIWCIVAAVVLAAGKFIAWQESPFYCFVIMGISTFSYETVLKKMGMNNDNQN